MQDEGNAISSMRRHLFILLLLNICVTNNFNKMWILLFLFALSECYREPSEMCKANDNQNCSFKFPYSEKNDCLIHTTKTCLHRTSIYSKNGIKLHSESKFSVQVYPYSAFEISVSAINMTLTVLESGIEGFSLLIEEKTMNLTICRYFDFKNNVTVGTVLFYDCLNNFVEYQIKHVKMTFTAYPMNEKLEYYVSIPSTVINSPPCRFSALIMVFCESLLQDKVTVKFFTPSELHNIDSYIVELVRNSTNELISSKNVTLSNSIHDQLVEFNSVGEGLYYVSVRPSNASATLCSAAKTDAFLVTIKSFDWVILLSLCIVLLLVLSLFLILKFFHIYMKPEISPKRVMLIHSFDCPEHDAFISSFSTYLYNLYKINSCTLYNKIENKKTWISKNTMETKNPLQWIRDRYQESDAIIYIVSEGLRITLDPNEKYYIKEGYPWRNQVASFQAHVDQFPSITAPHKKIYKICFPYYSSKRMPSCLENIGYFYMLPKDTKKFLNILLDRKPMVSMMNIYAKLEGTELVSSEEGRVLLKKLKEIQEAVRCQRHIEKIPKDDILEKTSDAGDSCVVEVVQELLTSNDSDTEEDHSFQENDFASPISDPEGFYEDEYKDKTRQIFKGFKTGDQNNYISLSLDEEFQ